MTRSLEGRRFPGIQVKDTKTVKQVGPGLFSVPGLMKIKVVKKAATKERKGINPFTHGSAIHTDIMKTEALKQALNKYGFDHRPPLLTASL